MPGLRQSVAQMVNSGFTVCYRPPEAYALFAPTAYILFTISGGPVWIKFILGRVTGVAEAGGQQMSVDICGVANLGGTVVAIAGAVNSIIMVPCNGAAVTPNALAHPWLDTAVASDGCYASLGNVVVNVSVAASTANSAVEWMMCYRKLNPDARVIAP
jgi:hypothetical protein